MDSTSRTNAFEAEFAVQLAKYLILQGYEGSQVTILTMYSAQLQHVQNLMMTYDLFENVRATVVDNFQGTILE